MSDENKNTENENIMQQPSADLVAETILEAEKALKKAKFRNTMFMFTIIFLIIGGIIYGNWKKQNDMDYIGGNVMYIGRSGTASTGDPWGSSSFVSQLAWSSVFNTDADYKEINPALAEKYEVSSDGLTYTIYMKDGLKWSDGQPLTAEDLAFSIECFSLRDSSNTVIYNAFSHILGMEEWLEVGVKSWENGGTHSLEGVSVDGNKVIIQLETPYTSFAHSLSQFIILPKHYFENHDDPKNLTDDTDFFQNPICSGMYKTDFLNEDGDLELILNENYYGELSDIERVILYGDYQNMHIDYYSTTNITEMTSFRAITGYEEFDVNVQFYRYFTFNLMAAFEQPELVAQLDDNGNEMTNSDGTVIMIENPELVEYPEDRAENLVMQNILLRQAISLAIDRETLLESVYYNAGSVDFLSAGSQEYSDFLLDYNPELARQKLLESGYDLERPLTIGYYHTDNNTTVYLAKVKEYLEEIGFQVIIKKTSGAVALYQQREYDFYLKAYASYNSLDWFNEYLSTNQYLSPIIGTDKFDELMTKLDATTTPSAFNEVMTEIQALDFENMYKIPLLTLNEAVYINGNRISVPEDMQFGCVRYRSELRLEEWSIKKG